MKCTGNPQTNTHFTQTSSGQCASDNHSPQSLSLSNSAGNLGGVVHVSRKLTYLTVPTWRLRLGQSGAESCTRVCLFYHHTRGLKQETCVTTQLTGCSVLHDSHIPVYQPLTRLHTHTQTKQFQSKQYAKHRKKKKKPNQPDLLSSRLGQRIMGVLTPLAFWEGTSQSPVGSLSLSLGMNFNLMPCPCKHMKKLLKKWIFKS